MKTLDEVIQEFERQEAFVAYYMQDGTQFRSDALHYLKEYRICREDLLENCKRHEELYNQYRNMIDESEKNDPLAWEQLKQMEGNPVWVEEENQPSQWYLIGEVETDEDDDPEFVSMTVFDCQGDYWFYKNNMGTKWQAYRKERE